MASYLGGGDPSCPEYGSKPNANISVGMEKYIETQNKFMEVFLKIFSTNEPCTAESNDDTHPNLVRGTESEGANKQNRFTQDDDETSLHGSDNEFDNEKDPLDRSNQRSVRGRQKNGKKL